MRTARPALLSSVVLLAASLGLAACSGSSGGAPSSSAPGSTAAPAATGATPPPGGAPASSGGPLTSAAPGSPSQHAPGGPPTGSGAGSQHPAHPVPSTPVSTVTVQGQHATYTVKIWAVARDRNCAAHAHGAQVTAFLHRHPCAALTRRLATTSVNGRAVGLSQITVRFPGPRRRAYDVASRFERLVHNSSSTGIDDLFRDGYGLPSGPQQVPSPDASDDLVGIGVVSFGEAWYLDGSTPNDDPALISMTEDVFQQL